MDDWVLKMTGKRIVLTGGPACGKTAVIGLLENKGFATVPENALEIIEEHDKKGINIFPWTDPIRFQEMAAHRQLEREQKLNGDTVILDRSLVDCRAFARHYQTPMPFSAEAEELESLPRYDHVFLLEMLPPPYSEITGNGHPRMSTPKERKRIETLIIEEYESQHYSIIRVPFMSIPKRVEFILEKSGLS